jgi:hypothetical protein
VRLNSATRTGVAGFGESHFSITERNDLSPVFISIPFNLFALAPAFALVALLRACD